MAIVYYTGTYPNRTISSTTHVGCVIKSETCEFRAMSDVYTTADYAYVWCPEDQEVKCIRVNINYMGCEEHGVITPDITTGEYAEDYEIYLLIQEDIKREQEALEEERRNAQRELEYKEAILQPKKGAVCRAIKGRKVPKGTEGVIFYIRDFRIGFKGEDGIAHWINADQIEINYQGKGYDWEPEDSWADEYQRARKRWQAEADARQAAMSPAQRRNSRYGSQTNRY